MANKKNVVIKVKYPAGGPAPETDPSSPEIITEWNIKRITAAVGILIFLIALLIFFSFDFDQKTSKKTVSPAEVTHNPVSERSSVDTAPPSLNKTDNRHVNTIKVAEEKNNSSPMKSGAVGNQSEAASEIPEDNSKKQDIAIKRAKAETIAVMETTKNNNIVLKEPVNKKIIRSVLSFDILNKEPSHIITSSVSVSKNRAKQIYYFTELKNMEKQTIYHEWLKNGKIVYRRQLNIAAKRWRTTSSKFFDRRSVGIWKVRTVDKKGNILDEKTLKIS